MGRTLLQDGAPSAVQLGIQAGNINVTVGAKRTGPFGAPAWVGGPHGEAGTAIGERMAFSEESAAVHTARNEVLDEFERKRRARALAVPTDDKRVRQRLRDLQEPMCLFGETVSGPPPPPSTARAG
jgi:hypothetical protein